MSEKRDAAELLGATLTDGKTELLEMSKTAVRRYHDAIINMDDDAMKEAENLYTAIVWKMNGGQFFGCNDSSNPEAGGIVVAQHCAAEPGTIPLWGQRGEFLVTVDGIRAVVKLGDGMISLWPHLSFHVVDRNRIFVSETGYLSHFCRETGGKTPYQLAAEIFSDLLAEKGRPLAKDYRKARGYETPRPWLDAIGENRGEYAIAETKTGQLGFAF